MKRVGLTSRVVEASGYHEPRDALSHNWVEWTQARNWMPFALFNSAADPAQYLWENDLDVLILTGGNDAVSHSSKDSYCEIRNRSEVAFLDVAVEEGIPVFAVCRGMHMLNLYFGGSVESDIGGAKENHIATTHPIEISNSVGGIFDTERLCTNSFHSQGFHDDRLAPALTSFAHSTDGYVEGVIHPELPIVGIQWHPEREHPNANLDVILVDRLVHEGSFWHVVE